MEAANLGSPERMIVTEVGVGMACGATRRCSSGVESAVASRDTHKSSVRGRVLSTAPSGRRSVSSGAGTCHQFPVGWTEKYLTDTLICFHRETGNLSMKSTPT